jgi:hypothetical protein
MVEILWLVVVLAGFGIGFCFGVWYGVRKTLQEYEERLKELNRG